MCVTHNSPVRMYCTTQTPATLNGEGFFIYDLKYSDTLDTSVVSGEVYHVKIAQTNSTFTTGDPDTCEYNIFPIVYAEGAIDFRTKIMAYDDTNDLILGLATTTYRVTDSAGKNYSGKAYVVGYYAMNLLGRLQFYLSIHSADTTVYYEPQNLLVSDNGHNYIVLGASGEDT